MCVNIDRHHCIVSDVIMSYGRESLKPTLTWRHSLMGKPVGRDVTFNTGLRDSCITRIRPTPILLAIVAVFHDVMIDGATIQCNWRHLAESAILTSIFIFFRKNAARVLFCNPIYFQCGAILADGWAKCPTGRLHNAKPTTFKVRSQLPFPLTSHTRQL